VSFVIEGVMTILSGAQPSSLPDAVFRASLCIYTEKEG
jgi:hypothetical protein